jgi:hypothetical protein
VVRGVLATAAVLATLSAAGAQERGRHGGLLSGMLPAQGRAGNGEIEVPPPFEGRTGVFDQSQRHCFGQDRQGRRVRVPC